MNPQNPILETIDQSARAAAGNTLPERLLSADSHVTEPPGCYIDRIDPAFRDRAPRVVRDADGGDMFVIDGMATPVPLGIVAAAGRDPSEIRKSGVRMDDLHRGGWDGSARVLDQARDGIAGEIIYPSVGMVICNHPDVDYKHACMWAYNRWLQEEFCAAAPGRLFGMGQTAVRSVAETIEEFRRFREMGFRGVMMPGNPATEFDYDHPDFDPLWRAAVELGLPLSFHILTSRNDGANAIGTSGSRQGAHRGLAHAEKTPGRRGAELL
ncbi:MAG: amidohydrolase family protein, partial [Gammaproteobacteria bacterium]